MIRAVVFDVGETLLDDTREFGAWADWIGVPRHTFSAVLGAVTAQGRNNAETFQYFRPGFDLEAERARREVAGLGEHISEADLYSDVRPALSQLRARGLWVGIAGNQTVRAAHLLRSLDLPVDAIATSGEWGVIKPDAAFSIGLPSSYPAIERKPSTSATTATTISYRRTRQDFVPP